jgi:hypothetical protein
MFTQAEPERIVKDNSTLSRPSSGSKKLNHCSNGIPVIQKTDSAGIVPHGLTNGSAIMNHVNGHHNHITEDDMSPAVNGHAEVAEGREAVNRRGRSRERHNPGIQRGEYSHFNCIFVSVLVLCSYRTTEKAVVRVLIWEDKSLFSIFW